MSNSALQVENGNFTRIVNPLLERLVQIPFKGCELAVAIYIIRKTYGFQKKQDEIPLTQFQRDLNRSRQTIVTAIKNLEILKIVNTARPTEGAPSKYRGNSYAINKYYDTWQLVNTARLVKRRHGTSPYGSPKLVQTARHSKETQKKVSKERGASQSDARLIEEVISSFEEVNPSFKRWYANTTQRASCDRLIATHGVERLQKVIKLLPRTNEMRYFPTVTTPVQLEDKWAQLEAALIRKKTEGESKQKIFV